MSESKSLRMFLLHHSQDKLDQVVDAPDITKVNLATLPLGQFQSNQISESRFWLTDGILQCDEEYVGVGTGCWDKKYPKHPLSDRSKWIERLAPDKILTPNFARLEKWQFLSQQTHPGMMPLIAEASHVEGINQTHWHCRDSVWAQTFICHRSILPDFLDKWRRMFLYLYTKFGFDMPFELGPHEKGRKAGYLCERLTMVYFASRTDLTVEEM